MLIAPRMIGSGLVRRLGGNQGVDILGVDDLR